MLKEIANPSQRTRSGWGLRKVTIGLMFSTTLVLAGCAPVASSYSPNSLRAGRALPPGPAYNLPVKVMSVSIGSNGFGLFVALHSAQYQSDPDASYILRYNPDGSSADKFEVEVDPATGLLKSIKVEADSKAAETITAISRSAGQLLGAFESERTGRTRLYATITLNYWGRAGMTQEQAVDELAAFNTNLNKILAEVISTQGCRLENEDVLSAAERKTNCLETGELRSLPFVPIKLEVGYNPFKSGSDDKACLVGICTRVERPAFIKLSTKGSVDTASVTLPNGSSPVPLPLRRTAFTKTTTEYTLVNGLHAKTTFETGAPLPAAFAAIGSIPGAVIGGFVDGVAEAGKLRKAKSDARTSKVESEEARKNASAKMKPDGDGQTEGNKPGYADSTFDAGVIAIVYPFPQPGTNVPGAQTEALRTGTLSGGNHDLTPFAGGGGSQPAPIAGRTTQPGPDPKQTVPAKTGPADKIKPGKTTAKGAAS